MVRRARSRRGATSAGCLVVLLLAAVVAFFGWEYGTLQYRNYAYQDAMKNAVRFAERYDDRRIKVMLRAKADSLGLPLEAKLLVVRRARLPRRFIEISAEYVDTVRTPLVRRVVTFKPRAEGTF